MRDYINLLLIVTVVVLILLYIYSLGERRKVRTQKNKLKTAIDYFIDGLIITDRSAKILNLNPKAEELLGIKKENVIGKTAVQSQDPYLDNLYKVISVFLEKGKREWKELSIAALPEKLIVRVIPVSVFDKKGKSSGIIFILRDVSREKEIDRIKSNFLTIMGHKLRTPLSEIKWAIEGIAGDKRKLSANQEEFLERCRKSTKGLVSQVDNLLYVSEIEKGLFKYKLRFEPLEDLIAQSIQDSSQFAKDKKVSLKYQEPSSPLPEISIDKEKISVVLHNLIDNAIRYSSKGSEVTIKLSKEGECLVFSIKDTGIGISKSEQRRVFTKFLRGKKAMKIYTEGTGLSLFVVKNIIEKHNGSVWFESKEEKGATFYFKLPIQDTKK